MRAALNRLLLPRPDCREKNSTLPTFLCWGGTTKSHTEPGRDCRGDGPEPGCIAPLGRSKWPWLCGHWRCRDGEGTSCALQQFQQSVDFCGNVNRDWTLRVGKEKGNQSLPTLETSSKHDWSLPVRSHPYLIGSFVRDAIKAQPGFMNCDDAKAFGSIWFKHFEHKSLNIQLSVSFAGLLGDKIFILPPFFSG